jgi:HEPN domain-containing protein
MPDPDAQRLAEGWLRFAQADLASAARMLEDRGSHEPRHACFAQQSAEKAIKAALVAEQIDFQKVHDLQQLVGLVDPNRAVARAAHDLGWLTQWAVVGRYPEPAWADAQRAVDFGETDRGRPGPQVHAPPVLEGHDTLSSGKRAQLLESVLHRHDVEIAMASSCSHQRGRPRQQALALRQALVQVADLEFLTQESVQSTFVDDCARCWPIVSGSAPSLTTSTPSSDLRGAGDDQPQGPRPLHRCR